MIDLFDREPNKDKAGLSLTTFIPEVNKEAKGFFDGPVIATREYNGYLMRHTKHGWQFYDNMEWRNVYPKVNIVKKLIQLITNNYNPNNSPFFFVEEFENAESPFTDEYEQGEYWLVPPGNPYDPHLLIPVDRAEQLSNINELNLHEKESVEDMFYTLQDALYPLRDQVYGVIFTNAFGEQTRVRLRDFDWSDYED